MHSAKGEVDKLNGYKLFSEYFSTKDDNHVSLLTFVNANTSTRDISSIHVLSILKELLFIVSFSKAVFQAVGVMVR